MKLPNFIRPKVPSKRILLRALSVSDQAFFSASNFILMLLLARYYSDTDVAGFGIGLTVAIIVQGTLQNLYIAKHSVLLPSAFARRNKKILAQHLIVLVTIIAAEIITGLGFAFFSQVPLHTHYLQTITISMVVCTLLQGHLDFDRVALIKHDKYKLSFFASIVFLILNLALLFSAQYFNLGFFAIMFIMGGYAATKILLLLSLIGRPDFFWGWRLVKRSLQKNTIGTVACMAGSTGITHAPLFVLGISAPPLQSAAFVALRGLIQPLNIIVRSLDMVDKNAFQTSGVITKELMKKLLFKQLILYVGLSTCTITGTLVLGKFVLNLIYTDRYEDFFPVLVGWAFLFSTMTVCYPIETVLVRLSRLNLYNYLRIGAASISVGLSFLLCPLYGALGAIISCLVGWGISAGISVWLIRDVLFPQEQTKC